MASNQSNVTVKHLSGKSKRFIFKLTADGEVEDGDKVYSGVKVGRDPPGLSPGTSLLGPGTSLKESARGGRPGPRHLISGPWGLKWWGSPGLGRKWLKMSKMAKKGHKKSISTPPFARNCLWPPPPPLSLTFFARAPPPQFTAFTAGVAMQAEQLKWSTCICAL